MSVEAIRIESRWGPPDLDQIPENPPEFVGILNDGDDFHLGTAFRTHEGIQLVNLREKPGPGAFVRIDVDLFIPIRQWCRVRGRLSIRQVPAPRPTPSVPTGLSSERRTNHSAG